MSFGYNLYILNIKYMFVCSPSQMEMMKMFWGDIRSSA